MLRYCSKLHKVRCSSLRQSRWQRLHSVSTLPRTARKVIFLSCSPFLILRRRTATIDVLSAPRSTIILTAVQTFHCEVFTYHSTPTLLYPIASNPFPIAGLQKSNLLFHFLTTLCHYFLARAWTSHAVKFHKFHRSRTFRSFFEKI